MWEGRRPLQSSQAHHYLLAYTALCHRTPSQHPAHAARSPPAGPLETLSSRHPPPRRTRGLASPCCRCGFRMRLPACRAGGRSAGRRGVRGPARQGVQPSSPGAHACHVVPLPASRLLAAPPWPAAVSRPELPLTICLPVTRCLHHYPPATPQHCTPLVSLRCPCALASLFPALLHHVHVSRLAGSPLAAPWTPRPPSATRPTGTLPRPRPAGRW